MHERERSSEIPSGITPEGNELFKDLFGISFEQAQDLATWEGEVGERYRLLFKYLNHIQYTTDVNKDQPILIKSNGEEPIILN